MTATAPPVKMAACPPIDGDGVDSEDLCLTTSSEVSKICGSNSQAKLSSARGNQKVISSEGEKAYDTVASFEESELRCLLEEVISQNRSKNDKSAIAQFLIRKEEDALREESGSGEDTIELGLGRPKKKRSNCRKDNLDSSAASRNTTGGSLGSLHNLSDSKVPDQTNTNTKSVASRSRAGGSCGNLSKGSFETHVGRRKNKKSKEINRASASQREGGSLQNLSKTEVASNESKKLHKSGSLSQVFSEVGGARIKNRRAKTSSESSGRACGCRRSEEREAGAAALAVAAGAREESWGEEGLEFPSQGLPTSSICSASGNCGEPTESCSSAGMVGGHWNEDPMSDVPSGETTEEDGELLHVSARDKLCGETASRHGHGHRQPSQPPDDGIDTELHSIHVSNRDVLSTISSDSEVDKPIKFSLGCKNQEETMTTNSSATVLPCTATFVTSDVDGKFVVKEDEVDKRKFPSMKSDSENVEKTSLDENGNPVLMSVRSSSSSSSSTAATSISSLHQSCSDRHTSSLSIGRRNGFSAQTKDISMYSRLKAKQDKKKAIKDKDVMPSEKTPGFRGDDTLDAILKFLGADGASNSKSKKKNKGKKEEEKDVLKKNKRSFEKSSTDEIDFEKIKLDEFGNEHLSPRKNYESFCGNDVRERKAEEERKNCKRGKDQERKRGKKGSGGLRESSSVEDLVSKSKQFDNVGEVRKQMTVDDGDVSLSGHSPYHSHQHNESQSSASIKSEFSYDFYKIGDALLDPEPISSESGDFEIVSRKKGKKSKNSSTASQCSRSGGSGGWNENQNNGANNNYYLEDQRRSTFFSSIGSRNLSQTSSQTKPTINFCEGPFPMHDGVFLSQFSGSRSLGGGERYTTTTSVPHSEDSDSDGGDSVHSMPAHAITQRPHVRKPPPSTDSTPQASYANIAKLAPTPNKSQMKKAVNNAPGNFPSDEDVERIEFDDLSSPQYSKAEASTSILDANFPPLGLGSSSVSIVAVNTNICKLNDTINVESNQQSFVSQDLSPLFKNSEVTFSSLNSDYSSVSENVFKVHNSLTNDNGVNLAPRTKNTHTSKMQANPIHHSSNTSSQYTPHQSHCVSSHHSPVVGKPIVPQQQQQSHLLHHHPETFSPPPKPSDHVPPPTLMVAPPNNNSVAGTKSSHRYITPQTQQQTSNNYFHNLPKDESERSKTLMTRENKLCSSKHYKSKDILDTSGSRNKRYEAAVIFTDNAKFDLSITGLEFGFDMSLENLTNLSEKNNDKNIKHIVINDKKLDIVKSKNTIDNNKNLINLQSTKQDYTKLYQAPANDAINFNYEELCRHVYKAWESTLRMLEDDPKNIQYWKAPSGTLKKN